mgnify:CR=1 FL=1
MQDLKTERANLFDQAFNITEDARKESRDLTPDEERSVDQKLDAAEEVATKIEADERSAKLDRLRVQVSQPATPTGPVITEARATAPATESRAATESREWDECLRHWRSCGRDRPQIRTMNETDDSSVVPVDLLDELIRLVFSVSGTRNAVSTAMYPNGVEIPRVATNISITATTAEGTAFDNVEPTFDKVDFSTALSASATTGLTVQIMESSRPDLIREVLTQHAEELSRFWSNSYCNGLGAADADCDGIFSAVDPTGLNILTAAGTGAITAAELIELRYSTLPAKYWTAGGDLSWLMGQATFASIMGLLDNTTGRPIFQPAAEATMANALQGTILGLPVYIDAGAPDMATGNKTVALLSRDAYRIADRAPGLVSNVNPWAQQSSGIVEVNSYYRSTGRWMRPQSAAIIQQA